MATCWRSARSRARAGPRRTSDGLPRGARANAPGCSSRRRRGHAGGAHPMPLWLLAAAVPMCLMRPTQLASEVVERNDLLGAGGQVLQLDVAVGQLIAEDHREMASFLGCRLELLAELAPAELGPCRDAGLAQ